MNGLKEIDSHDRNFRNHRIRYCRNDRRGTISGKKLGELRESESESIKLLYSCLYAYRGT